MPYASHAEKIARQRFRRHNMNGYQSIAHELHQRQRIINRVGFDVANAPFCAVDGEGGGVDTLGRQNYLLLRAGEHYIFSDNIPLKTSECLAFLSSLPAGFIYVAYYFDYDVTMILRDTDQKTRDRILKPRAFFNEEGKPQRQSTYIGDFEIEYLPHKYFKVRRVKTKYWTTINEVGPFFQCSFLKAITDWNIGTEEERETIKVNKAARVTFEKMTEVEIEYNRLECKHLEQLMEAFREVCRSTGYVPSKWQGPGFLATDMMRQHDIPKRRDLKIPEPLFPFANAAYYGGRFELFKIGTVRNIYEYDINSAYPTAMADLPCLEHGSWRKDTGKPKGGGTLYIAAVQFEHQGFKNSKQIEKGCISDLPIRDKKSGTIYWPYQGNGVYWSWEIEAAQQAHMNIIDWRDHWCYHRECDCKPFDFLEKVYAIRQKIGKGTKGYSLKLAINSLYGKTAQSIGSAPYANPVWAGLITAHCRAKLITATNQIDSRDIVMLATDGIYTRQPLNLPLGKWLGQWEMKQHDTMFFVQPGIYFYADGSKPKTRGVPMAMVLQEEQTFRERFAFWQTDLFGEPRGYPSVDVPVHSFIGLKLAQAWNRPNDAGKWVDSTRKISFDFRTKRDFAMLDADCINTFPRQGAPDLYSEPYSRDIGRWRAEAELFDAMAGDQPDFFAFTAREAERHG